MDKIVNLIEPKWLIITVNTYIRLLLFVFVRVLSFAD